MYTYIHVQHNTHVGVIGHYQEALPQSGNKRDINSPLPACCQGLVHTEPTQSPES